MHFNPLILIASHANLASIRQGSLQLGEGS
jgi:hypothetical protein